MATPPQWNPSDPAASLVELWEFLHNHARDVLLNDGTHIEILFLIADDGTLQPQPIAPPMTRKDVTETLRVQLPGSSVYGLIHIAEAWAYIPAGRGDHTVKQLKLGEMRVSDLKDEHKTEGLIVSLLSRNGDSRAHFDEIIRTPGNALTLGRSVQLPHAHFPPANIFTAG